MFQLDKKSVFVGLRLLFTLSNKFHNDTQTPFICLPLVFFGSSLFFKTSLGICNFYHINQYNNLVRLNLKLLFFFNNKKHFFLKGINRLNPLTITVIKITNLNICFRISALADIE